MKNKLSTGQKILFVIIFIVFAFSMAFSLRHSLWVVKYGYLFDFNYSFHLVLLVLTALGCYGIYEVMKFGKKGFIYAYIGLISSAIARYGNYVMIQNPRGALRSIIFSVILIVIFYFSTRSIYKKCK